MNRFSACLSLLIILQFSWSCRPSAKKNFAIISTSSYYELKDETKIDETWPTENSLRVHLTSEPDNLHPVNGNSTPRTEIFQYIHRFLVRVNVKNGNLIPDLADSLPIVSDDGKAWTFRLKKNSLWKDGSMVNAKDVLFTARVNKWLLTRNPTLGSYWDNVKEIVSGPDDYTFTVRLKSKSFQNIAFFTTFPIIQSKFHDPANLLQHLQLERSDDSLYCSTLPKELIDWSASFNDASTGRIPSMINGCGDYEVMEWNEGLSIALKRKNKPSERENIDLHQPAKIIYTVIKDDNSVLLSLRNQSVDLSTSLSLSSFFNLMKDERQKNNFKGILMPTYSYTYLALNEKPQESGRPDFFSDQKVRRAAALLTPVDEVLKTIYKEFGNACKKMSSNVSPLKTESDPDLKSLEYNPENAALLLKAAGWSDKNADGILDHPVTGAPFSPELLYLNNSTDWKDMAMLIAASFRKAGINIQLIPVDLNLFITRARAHDFDMLLGSWSNSIFPEDYHQLWHTSSWENRGSNYSGFGSKESDQLIDSLQSVTEMSQRIQLSRRLQKMIYEDQPYVFMYCTLRRNVIHNRFSNRIFFSERPGIYIDRLRLLTTRQGINPEHEVNP